MVSYRKEKNFFIQLLVDLLEYHLKVFYVHKDIEIGSAILTYIASVLTDGHV